MFVLLLICNPLTNMFVLRLQLLGILLISYLKLTFKLDRKI